MPETDRQTDTQTDYSMPLLRLRAPRHNNQCMQAVEARPSNYKLSRLLKRSERKAKVSESMVCLMKNSY